MKTKKLKKINTLALSIIVMLAVIPMIFADTDDYANCGMMSGFSGNYGTAFMILSWIIYLATLALIMAGVYWLIKSANKKR